MYKAFYGFEENLFRVTPDRRLRFSNDGYTEAFETLLEAMRQGRGLAVLTGEPGTGKSTLLGDLAADLESDGYIVGKVSNSRIDIDYLARLVGFWSGRKGGAPKKSGLSTYLKKRLIGKGSTGQSLVLLIDDAQDLSTEVLEDLHLLFKSAARQGRNVQILLTGQERLWVKLRRPECKQILKLVAESCRLRPLSPIQTRAYIPRALRHIGWSGNPVISTEAMRSIYEHTGGVLRLINSTIGRLLLHGGLSESPALGPQDVKTVLEQMEEDHPELLCPTSDQAPPSQIRFSSLILPLDARAAEGFESDEPLIKQGVFLPDGDQDRNRSEQAVADRPKPVARGRWKWVLAGLSVAAISVYMIIATSFEEEGSGRSATGARERPEQPRSARALAADQSAPARAQMPPESSARAEPIKPESDVVDSHAPLDAIEAIRPDQVDDKWWIARSELTSDAPPDRLVEIPPSSMPSEIAEAMPQSSAQSKSSVPSAPLGTETDVVDLRNGVEGTDAVQADLLEDKWWIARSEPASDDQEDPGVGTPKTVVPAETTEPISRIDAVSEESAQVSSVESETESADTRKESRGAEDLEPDLRDRDPPIAEPAPTPDSLENARSETPATVESKETTQAAAPSGIPAKGQDGPSRDEQEINTLLAKAERALSDNRLMLPSDDNAYGYYNMVLARDPGNKDARDGLGRIVQRYRQLAKQRLKGGDARGAKLYASRGLKIWSQDEELLELKRRAAKAQAPRENNKPPQVLEKAKPPQVLEKVKKWFRSGDTSHHQEPSPTAIARGLDP